MYKILYILILSPLALFAQHVSPPAFEIFAGLGASRPLGVSKDIAYQGSSTVDLGIHRNIFIQNNGNGFVGLTFSYLTQHIEGNFIEDGNKDHFIRTADNVKVNSLIFVPVLLEAGYSYKIKSRFLLSGSAGIMYINKMERQYKIGEIKFKDQYSFNKKFSPAVGGAFGYTFSSPSYRRVEFNAGYVVRSLSATNGYHPTSIGLRLIQGL